MKISIFIIFVFIVASFLWGCSHLREVTESSVSEQTPHYTSSFPYVDVSGQLDRIHRSLVRISTSTIYQKYYFNGQELTAGKLDTLDVSAIADHTDGFSTEQTGTAVVIARHGNTIYLLTSSTALSPPDTLIQYRQDSEGIKQGFIKNITVSVQRFNIALKHPFIGEFEIVARTKDLSLLKIEAGQRDMFDAEPLKISFGNPEDLKLGSFIFVLGYPQGQAMTERGIVSVSEKNKNLRYFYTDALYNEGLSGGIVLATKDNFKTFDWVGMIYTAAEEQESFLVPDYSRQSIYKNMQTYRGPYRIASNIYRPYGITRAVSSPVISEFLEKYNSLLNADSFKVKAAKEETTAR